MRSHINVATNGIQALKQVKQHYLTGLKYNLIFMDCNMPQMDGYQATEMIRKFIFDNNFE